MTRPIPRWIAERYANDPQGMAHAMKLREDAFPATKVDALVVIGDADSFGAPLTITHDGEFVQVTISHRFKSAQTYCRRINYSGNEDACARVADHVEEVAALVSAPALVAWLLDCGFALTP